MNSEQVLKSHDLGLIEPLDICGFPIVVKQLSVGERRDSIELAKKGIAPKTHLATRQQPVQPSLFCAGADSSVRPTAGPTRSNPPSSENILTDIQQNRGGRSKEGELSKNICLQL